jgi:methylmalonyl-CoA mutase N-terminal domain/subunit
MISISGYHIREAGSTAVQELAFTLADGMAYVEAAMDRGLPIDSFAPQLSFFFNSHNSLFEEVAKFRAARRIWGREMRDRYGAQHDRSLKLKFHTQTAGASLTEQQPLNNIVRVTIQALAAVLGGTQSLHTNSYDEAMALPTEQAARIALRTQQILAHESGVADTIDPLAGSYFIEDLTNTVEAQAMDYIREVEEMGDGSVLNGVLRGVDDGFFQNEIAQAAYTYQKQVESGEQTIVGVNKYASEDGEEIPILRIDPEVERRQRERTERVKADRDDPLVRQRLDELQAAVEGGDNAMDQIVEAVKAYASVGEIMEVYKQVHGAYREPVMI